jgi:hypothetical protein
MNTLTLTHPQPTQKLATNHNETGLKVTVEK